MPLPKLRSTLSSIFLALSSVLMLSHGISAQPVCDVSTFFADSPDLQRLRTRRPDRVCQVADLLQQSQASRPIIGKGAEAATAAPKEQLRLTPAQSMIAVNNPPILSALSTGVNRSALLDLIDDLLSSD